MKRLRLILIVFALLLTVPLAWLVARTYDGLAREETSQLDFFAETILDQMEIDLAELIRREETRSVDEYSDDRHLSGPLAARPDKNFIIGYFQNGPDGSFQSPLPETNKELAGINEQLREINEVFKERFFIDLPQHDFYSPQRREGKEAEADARFLRKLSRSCKLPLKSESFNVPAFARKEKLSPEEAGREPSRQPIQQLRADKPLYRQEILRRGVLSSLCRQERQETQKRKRERSL